jgi:hypothetical protein
VVAWPSTSLSAEQQPAPGAEAASELVLTLDCREAPGIVHAVSGVLLEHGCNIVELKHCWNTAATSSNSSSSTTGAWATSSCGSM